MPHSFILSPQAERDYEEIWDYTALDSVDAADRVIDSFDHVFALIATQQKIGRRERALGKGIRKFPKGNYILYYRILDKNTIQAVRVIHGARDIPSIFDFST